MSAPFLLSYTPTIRDWERASRARVRATRSGWISTSVIAVAGVVAVATGDYGLAIIWWALALLYGSGLWMRWYRRLFVWRRNPALLEPTSITADDAGIQEKQASSETRLAWSHFASTLVLDDLLLLSTSSKANGMTMMLARRGLSEPDRWDELVGVATSHVPLHPRSRASRSRP